MWRSIVVFVSLVTLIGCGSGKDIPPTGSPAPAANSNNAPQAPGNNEDPQAPLPSPTATDSGPVALVAEGWTEIELQAKMAKITIDQTGHFLTTRNYCGRDAWGVLELADWNRFAAKVNKAMTAPVSPSEQCLIPSEGSVLIGWGGYYGAEEGGTVKTGNTKKALYKSKNRQEFCLNVADKKIAQDLFEALNWMVETSDRQSCSLAPPMPSTTPVASPSPSP